MPEKNFSKLCLNAKKSTLTVHSNTSPITTKSIDAATVQGLASPVRKIMMKIPCEPANFHLTITEFKVTTIFQNDFNFTLPMQFYLIMSILQGLYLKSWMWLCYILYFEKIYIIRQINTTPTLIIRSDNIFADVMVAQNGFQIRYI